MNLNFCDTQMVRIWYEQQESTVPVGLLQTSPAGTDSEMIWRMYFGTFWWFWFCEF